MQELVGRLTALDPQASESLKVVSYFDALAAGGANIESVVRGAAVLSGVIAGVRSPAIGIRVSPDGDRLDHRAADPSTDAGADPDANGWPCIRIAGDAVVWIERADAAHANDAMVLERFAVAASLTLVRQGAPRDGAVTTLLDHAAMPGERAAAAGALGFFATDRVRVRATATTLGTTTLGTTTTDGPSALIATPHGVLRATVIRGDAAPPPPDTGLGTWGHPDDLPRSLAAAGIAFRLAQSFGATVDAEQLGILLDALLVLADRPRPPDVEVLARIDDRTSAVLHALVEAESVRAAATALGMHHSTLQARHESLTRELGYDPRSPRGRARYELADLLRRLG